MEERKGRTRNLYTVEIPDDNGSNYLHWEDVVPKKVETAVKERLLERLSEGQGEAYKSDLKQELDDVFRYSDFDGASLYRNISAYLGGDKQASLFLSDMGFVGISYPAQATTGGRADGARNYVIFNVNDAQITDRVEFLRTTDGTVYGWTVGGRIYLTPEGVNPNTPVHEYTHLWASAIEQRNPELWASVVDAMKLSPMWAEVMADEAYRDIWNDDNRMTSEVLSRLSGEENYRRAMERAEADIKSDRNPLAVAEKISAWERVKRALSDFWNKVKEILGQPVTGEPMGDAPAWMEFVNGAIGDFYKGVNPNVENNLPQAPELMFIGEKGAANLDKAEEATTRLDNLSVARDMESAGKDAKAIKLATGWERGADGKWRYETEDVKLKETLTIEGKEFKRDEVEMLWRNGKLIDHVDNPALFDAYPELAEVRIETDDMLGDNVSNGEYNPRTNTITIHASEPKYLQSILNHEIQHAIQHIEGFAKGGNSESGRLYEHMTSDMAIKKLMSERNRLEKEFYESAVGPEVEREVDEWLDEHPDFNDEEAKKHEEYLFGKYPEYKDFLSRLAQLPNLEKEIRKPKTKYEAYRRLAGEVESRNVQKRMGMSEEERRNSLTEETEDVARKDQIFLYDNLGESALMGSRVDARMAEVAAHFDGKQLTEEQQAVVDVFGGKADNLTISVKTKDGNERKVVMRQGNEINAGTKHSLFRHYGMNNGAVTADDILLVPEIIENGERVEKKRGKKTVIEYKYTDNNGVEYTVITENNKGREEFANFYTNRKASSAARKTRSEEARDTADDASTDKGSNNSSTVQEEDTLFRDWYGGNSGYEGYSKSKRAVEAEERGLRNASQMNGEFAKQVNGIIEERTGEPSKLTLKDIKKVLPDIKADEWHHTSKFGNKTKYYSAENVASYFAKDPETELQERKEREIAERKEAYRRAVREKIPTRKVETELGEKDAFITSDGYAVEVPGNVLYMPEDARLFAIGELKDEEDYVVDSYSYWALENSEAFNKAVQEYVAAVEKAKNEVDAEIANDYREGVGSYTDDELALESDPVSKALGKPRFTRKQRREFAERERQRMVARVENLAKKLNLDNVEVVTDASTLEGKKQRAKGFYSKSTGKITIVIPNHSSAFDVEQTLLHEAVAHYGLRQLFGKHFDTFLDNVFNNADVEVRKRIVKLAMEKYGLDFRKATEEYLASLAENTEFENYNASWWQKIKKLFLDMLAKVGVKLDFALSDNELRYILWRSYKNLTAPASSRSVIDVAEDIAKQYELGVGNYATPQGAVANVAEDDIDAINERFNAELQQQIDGTLPKGHIYKLGMPSKVLQSAGLPNLPIELAASRLSDKSMQENHPFELSEIEGLVDGVQNPLAVFRSATHVGSFVVLTEIQHNGKNYVVAIETNRKQGRIEINSVRSIHYRNSNTHIANWIEEGLLEYADKKRMSEWFSKQQYNSADVRNLFRHSAKVVENFENPKIEEDYLFREGDPETDAPNTKDEYEKNVQGFWNNFKEAWIDKTRALKAAQEAIEKTTGKKIADHSNVWMYANQMQGMIRNDMELFVRNHFNTFGEFLKEMFKNEYLEGSNEEKQKQVERYTNCKHGIERNRDVAVKKAIADAADIEKVNRTFNKQLEKLTEENADSVILNLGMPAPLLQAAGVENKPMKLYGNKVVKKMKKHGFSIADLKDLPRAVAEPMAVFNNYGKDGNRAILTELITENGIFLVSVDLGKGADVDFNIITSVFGKDSESVIDWINKGFATYINKKKALAFLFHQSAPIAETAAKEELSSATKVVNSFNNPNVKSENVEYDKWLTEAENIHKMSLPWEEEQNMLDEAAKKYGAKLDTDYSGITAIFKDLKSYKDVKAA